MSYTMQPLPANLRIKAYGALSVSHALSDRVDAINLECFGPSDYFSNKGKLKHELSLDIRNKLFVAVLGKDIVGYLLCKIIPQSEKVRGERLGVTLAYRGVGIGKALIHRGLRYADSLDAEYITYIANENTASLRLHLNSGLICAGSDKAFIYLRNK